jgi:hypothetical protein
MEENLESQVLQEEAEDEAVENDVTIVTFKDGKAGFAWSAVSGLISNPELETKVKKICTLSVKQVSRVDKNLTKTDLLAILIKLNPIYKIHYDDMYKYLSFSDLNYIIRHEVYNDSISHIFKNELK